MPTLREKDRVLYVRVREISTDLGGLTAFGRGGGHGREEHVAAFEDADWRRAEVEKRVSPLRRQSAASGRNDDGAVGMRRMCRAFGGC